MDKESVDKDEPAFRYDDSNITLMNIVWDLFCYQNWGDSNIYNVGNRVWRKGRHSKDENTLVLAIVEGANCGY